MGLWSGVFGNDIDVIVLDPQFVKMKNHTVEQSTN